MKIKYIIFMHRLIAPAQQLTRPLKYRVLGLPALCLGEFSSCNCSLGALQLFLLVKLPRQGQGHASASPWEGVNALDAAALAYRKLSVLRRQLWPDWRLFTVSERCPFKLKSPLVLIWKDIGRWAPCWGHSALKTVGLKSVWFAFYQCGLKCINF